MRPLGNGASSSILITLIEVLLACFERKVFISKKILPEQRITCFGEAEFPYSFTSIGENEVPGARELREEMAWGCLRPTFGDARMRGLRKFRSSCLRSMWK